MTASAITRRLLSLLLLPLSALAIGCSPTHYRVQADHDVYNLVGRVASNPRWRLPHYTIQPDPRSRMFDPYDPDFEPMPPDDPAAHELMHCVDCKKGYPCWDKNGRTPFVENPDWKAFVPLDEQGRLQLDLRGAVAAALLNSPEYQTQLEELYLSALDVTFERFRFDTQFFAGYQSFFTTIGPDRSDGPSNELALSTRTIEARKMFTTGGELVVGLANSLIWEFTGTDNHTAFTMLDFSLVQPLLRGAGRARVMERLTLSERALLSDVRVMERFRHGFYAEIAAGIDAGSGPNRRGGLAGGSGLEGFTGVGAGGFGRLGNVQSGSRTGTGAGQAGGYYGLLQNSQQIRNLEFNVTELRNSLTRLQALYEAGRIDFFQVELARQALYNAQSRLLTQRAAYEASLDAFKITLGLPPDTPLVLSDPTLDRFNLIEQDLSDAQSFATDLLNNVRDLALDLTEDVWADLLRRSDELSRQVEEQIAVAQRDVEKMLENLPARRESLQRLAARPELNSRDVEVNIFSVERLDKMADKQVDDLAGLRRRHAATASDLDRIFTPAERADLLAVLDELNQQLSDLLLLQASARLESVVLAEVELQPNQALTIASENQLDWMNARSELVNTWRLIEFNANDLKSDLDVVFSGDIQNVGDNPVKLKGNAGRLRVGLEFDAPITRVAERNRYRQALIEYQQARRTYYTFVDRVYQGLRGTLRNIDLNQVNFEMRRAAVELAISQVELAQFQLFNKPPPVDVNAPPPDPGSDNRVQDLVNALNELLVAQDDLLSIWVNYEVLRLNLDFSLGTMRLDDHGQWIDPGPITADTLGVSPIASDCEPTTLGPESETVEPAAGEDPATSEDHAAAYRPSVRR